MKGQVIKDWSKLNFSNKNHQDNVRGAVQHFLSAPQRDAKEIRAAIQHFSTSAGFPAQYAPILEKYQDLSDYDNGYETIFKTIDVSTAPNTGFAVQTNSNAISFNKVVEGDAAKIYDFSGTQLTITYDQYAAGLNWSRNLIDDGNFYALEENTVFARNQFYKSKSEVFYAMIEAVASTNNVAWQAPTPSGLAATDANYTAVRDVNTVNTAAQNLIALNLDKGYGVTGNTTFVVLYPYQLSARMARVQGVLNSSLSGNLGGAIYNFQFVKTIGLASATTFYVAIPKVKKYAVERMPLTVYTDFDITRRADLMVAWARYGGAIADTDTIVRCATS